MATANITASQTTQRGDFSVTVTFLDAVSDFGESNIMITAVSGNGITGIHFEIAGSGTTYNVEFYLPIDVEGEIDVDIIGMVTPEGSSTPESVTATALRVMYDNISDISAEFGTVEYRDGAVIAVPVVFAEAVIAPNKGAFRISHVSGDPLTDVAYILLGEGTAHELQFFMAVDRKGSFRISAMGDVFKTSSGVWDNIIMSETPNITEEVNDKHTLVVPYNMRLPNFEVQIPHILEPGINDFYYDFEELSYKLESSKIEVSGLSVTPTIYRAVATDTRPEAGATLDSSDWVLATDGHTEHAKFYLLRFDVPASALPGTLNVFWHAGAIRTVPNVI